MKLLLLPLQLALKPLFIALWFGRTCFQAVRKFFFPALLCFALTLYLHADVRGLVFSPLYAMGVGNTGMAETELVPLDTGRDDSSDIQRNDWIAGYRVSDPFLGCTNAGRAARKTDAPEGCRFWDASNGRPHLGVDIVAGVGVPLYAWEPAAVTCYGSNQSRTGYGLWAEIRPNDNPSVMFLAGHLNRCSPGDYIKGKAFGEVGNSGYSTGPHLHFEYLSPPQRGGQKPPLVSQVEGVMTGKSIH